MNPNFDHSPARVRQLILEAGFASGEGHIPSSFSIVEILMSIWDLLPIPKVSNLNRLVLSKGHGSYAYYAMLRHQKLMSTDEFDSIGKVGSKYYGHLPYIPGDPRFQFGSGSLGHGFPFAAGLAYSAWKKNDMSTFYCILGDGEANEGTFWETLLLLEKFQELNLVIFVDVNGSSERAIPIRDALAKIGSCFKYIRVRACNGHSLNSLKEASSGIGSRLVLAETKKGYPLREMMSNPSWHHRKITLPEFEIFSAELLSEI
jgi:transketolase